MRARDYNNFSPFVWSSWWCEEERGVTGKRKDLISIHVENIIELITRHLNPLPPCGRQHSHQFHQICVCGRSEESHPIPSPQPLLNLRDPPPNKTRLL